MAVPTTAWPESSNVVPYSVLSLPEHTLEIVSDSGEGAQKCGQVFGAVSAKMGNGVWTVEIIPAEIQPPPRTPEGASGYRIRIGSRPITNWGDAVDLVVAFNEQVLLSRHRLGVLGPHATVLVENSWASHPNPDIQAAWATAMDELSTTGYRIIQVPMEEQCLTIDDNPRKGKNMFALGMLASIYQRDLGRIEEQIAYAFRKKSEDVYERNVALLHLGHTWAEANLDFQIDVAPAAPDRPLVVMNGNEALALGVLASGMELCAMYPITPATSVSHFLAEVFEKFGGVLHQAEDEIAAAGVAIGASYAGKVACTVTSGPGLALKTEFILAARFAQPGDAPRIVIAPATIEECFHSVVTARRLAEAFRTVVVVLSDANLATGVQPFPRPELRAEWQGAEPDLSPVAPNSRPYDWDPQLGISKRIIPGQPGGMFTVTGLSHDEKSKVAYGSGVHQRATTMRSRKLAVLQQMLTPPKINGDPDGGDLLVVGWGSTKGAIEEAVERLRETGGGMVAVDGGASSHCTAASRPRPTAGLQPDC